MSINYYYFSCRVAYNLSHCGVVIILYTFKHLRSLLNQVKKCGQKQQVNNKVLRDLNNKKKKKTIKTTKIKLTTYNMNLLIYSINLYQL